MPKNDNYWGSQPQYSVGPQQGGVGQQPEPPLRAQSQQAPLQGQVQQGQSAHQAPAQQVQQVPAQQVQQVQQGSAQQVQTQQIPAQQTYRAPAQQAPAQQPDSKPDQPSDSGRGAGQPTPVAGQQPAYAAAVPTAAYAPVQKKSRGWIVAIVIAVCLCIFGIFCVKSCSDTMVTFGGGGYDAPNITEDSIAVISIDGTIQYDGTACSPEGFKELLDQAEENSHVKAIVLRVNSGGGTATAGEEMAEYLKDFKKPVVVSSASINASAAYEISAQADYIFVARSTEIGAIGTAMQLTDLSGLMDMLGIKMDVITSADSKDSSYGYRPLTEEERQYYQEMVNQINQMFIDNVAEGRKMSVEQVRTLATGLSFTGETAVKNGLADEIGTREDAVAKAAQLAGVENYETTDLYLPSYDLSSLSYLFGSNEMSTDDLVELLREKGADGQSAGLK